MEYPGIPSLTELVAKRARTAANALRFHDFPRGVTLRRPRSVVWTYNPDTETLSADVLLSGKILAPKIPVRMEVGFFRGSESVKSVSVMCIDPNSGLTYGSQIGISPMIAGGPFRTEFRGAEVEVDWDHALQTVYYFANLYADHGEADEVEALRRLHAFGSVHGRAVGDLVPGVAALEDIGADGMIGDSAGPDTEFGRALRTCVTMASRFENNVSRDHYKSVAAVANLWARHGHSLEERFVFEPQVIHVDFSRGKPAPDAAEEATAAPGL